MYNWLVTPSFPPSILSIYHDTDSLVNFNFHYYYVTLKITHTRKSAKFKTTIIRDTGAEEGRT